MKIKYVLIEKRKETLHVVVLLENLRVSLKLGKECANLSHSVPYLFVAFDIRFSGLFEIVSMKQKL